LSQATNDWHQAWKASIWHVYLLKKKKELRMIKEDDCKSPFSRREEDTWNELGVCLTFE
jgi:hypothetical protein